MLIKNLFKQGQHLGSYDSGIVCSSVVPLLITAPPPLLLLRGALHGTTFAANFGTGRLEWGILRSEDSSRRNTPL